MWRSIPLIPRRVGTPETGSKLKIDKNKPAKGSQKDTVSEEILVILDVDEKLLFDAHGTAVAAVDKLVSDIQNIPIKVNEFYHCFKKIRWTLMLMIKVAVAGQRCLQGHDQDDRGKRYIQLIKNVVYKSQSF